MNFEGPRRARILLRNMGLMNVYAQTATGRFLGAEMLAPGGEHLAHLLAWALQSAMTKAIAEVYGQRVDVFPHPVTGTPVVMPQR